jgi:hypothetical protein
MIQVNKFIDTRTSGEYNYNTLKDYRSNNTMNLEKTSIIECCVPAIYAIAIFMLAFIIKKLNANKGFTLHVTHGTDYNI